MTAEEMLEVAYRRGNMHYYHGLLKAVEVISQPYRNQACRILNVSLPTLTVVMRDGLTEFSSVHHPDVESALSDLRSMARRDIEQYLIGQGLDCQGSSNFSATIQPKVRKYAE